MTGLGHLNPSLGEAFPLKTLLWNFMKSYREAGSKNGGLLTNKQTNKKMKGNVGSREGWFRSSMMSVLGKEDLSISHFSIPRAIDKMTLTKPRVTSLPGIESNKRDCAVCQVSLLIGLVPFPRSPTPPTPADRPLQFIGQNSSEWSCLSQSPPSAIWMGIPYTNQV